MNFNFFLQSSIESDLTIMWITIAGFLVFFMHAGFTLVEAGFTQSKNAVNMRGAPHMAPGLLSLVPKQEIQTYHWIKREYKQMKKIKSKNIKN